MGTTKTAIQAGGGRYCYTLLIGGYPKALTTWTSTSAVATALAATDWSTVIRGLEAPGEITQSIAPFRPRLDSSGVVFVVKPDNDDTFAKDVWATDLATGAQCRLTTDVDSNDGTFVTSDTGDFAASGNLFIGTEYCSYSGLTANSFTGVGRGLNEPFGTEALTRRFGRPHVTNIVAGGAVSEPLITDFPRTWIGRAIACYCHRVVDGVVDVIAQAELVFAGHVASVTDSESGAQHIACEDMRDYVGRGMLLGNQWSALPAEGANLLATDFISFTESALNTSTVPPVAGFVANNDVKLTVGTGGWISTGINTVDQILDGINDFLQDAVNTSNTLDGFWAFNTPTTRHTQIAAGYITASTNSWDVFITVKMTDTIAGMLGFGIEGTERDGGPGTGHPLMYKADASGDDPIVAMTGPYAQAWSSIIVNDDTTLTVEGPTGTFIDQASTVMEPWKSIYDTTGDGTWGFLRFNNYLFLVKKNTATTFTVHYDEQLLRILQVENAGARIASDTYYGVGLFDDMFVRFDDIIPRFKQILVIHEPKLDDWLRKSFYSTGTTDYNETTGGYDKYDRQMSLGIPFEILGTAFATTCTELADRTNDSGVTVIVNEPTKFSDVLLPELLLRNAHLVQKGAELGFVMPGVTTASEATHTLTESSKASSPGGAANDFSQTSIEREDAPITHIKVKYDRDVGGAYHQTTEIVNEQARTDHGAGEALTIEARNAFTFGRVSGDDAVRELIADLSANILKFWSKPIPMVNRTLAAPNWFINPGETISLTDNFVRDATTGARGITTMPGWALRVSRNWKLDEMRGVIDVAVHGNEAGRRAVYSPAAKIDDDANNNGYTDSGTTPSSANPTIFLKANEFSTTAENDDGDSFDVGDLIVLVEKSPTTIATPTKLTATIDTKLSSTSFELTGTIAFDNTLEYYMHAQAYGAATATQQVHAFIGDDADSQIVDSARTKLWGQQPFDGIVTTAPEAKERHEYPVDDGTWEDDGEPCTPVSHRNTIFTAMNMTNRRTSPHCPQVLETAASTTSTSYVQAMFPFACYIGNGELTGSLYRKLWIGPIMEVDDSEGSNSSVVRVTSSAVPPRAAIGASDMTTVAFVGPKAQTEWTVVGSTTYSNETRLQLEIVPVPGRPYTWLTVEFKTAAANALFFTGFHEFWMSELGG